MPKSLALLFVIPLLAGCTTSPSPPGIIVEAISPAVGAGGKLVESLGIPSRFTSSDGTNPKIGDIVQLDQGFTFPDGEPGCLVHLVREDGHLGYEAMVYKSEIGRDISFKPNRLLGST